MPEFIRCSGCGAKLPSDIVGLCAECFLTAQAPGEDFVGSFLKPTPLDPGSVAKLQANLETGDEAADAEVELEVGDRVRIKEGPFQDHVGSVDEVFADKQQVRVVVTMFGHATPVDVQSRYVVKM